MNLFHLGYILVLTVPFVVVIIGMGWFIYHRRKRKAR